MLFVIEYPIAFNKPVGFSDILWQGNEDLQERQAHAKRQIDDLLSTGAEVLEIIKVSTEREHKAIFFIWSGKEDNKTSVKTQRVTKS